MMVSAMSPNAELWTLDVMLEHGVTNTVWGRNCLVDVVAERCWYHWTDSNGREVWILQDEDLLAERQRTIPENLSLSEDQKAQFWLDGSYSP